MGENIMQCGFVNGAGLTVTGFLAAKAGLPDGRKASRQTGKRYKIHSLLRDGRQTFHLVFFKFKRRMEIIIQRDFYIRMPQNLAESFGVHPDCYTPGGKRMAQRMKIQIPDTGPRKTALVLILKRSGFHGHLRGPRQDKSAGL